MNTKSDLFDKVYRISLYSSIAVFLAALVLPIYCYHDGCPGNFQGLFLLLFGFLSLGSTFAWLANPFLVLAWISLRYEPRLSFIFSIIATFFASTFFNVERIMANEAGHSKPIAEYNSGFYCWYSSSIIILIGSIVLAWINWKRK